MRLDVNLNKCCGNLMEADTPERSLICTNFRLSSFANSCFISTIELLVINLVKGAKTTLRNILSENSTGPGRVTFQDMAEAVWVFFFFFFP